MKIYWFLFSFVKWLKYNFVEAKDHVHYNVMNTETFVSEILMTVSVIFVSLSQSHRTLWKLMIEVIYRTKILKNINSKIKTVI